jgi:hypothetical protein
MSLPPTAKRQRQEADGGVDGAAASAAPAAATLFERFHTERTHLLQALDDKYRAEDEAHPEDWIV